MLLCDVSTCPDHAVTLIHFKGTSKPYAYCSRHAFNRRGEPVFGHRENGVWISAVRHVERLHATKGDQP